MKRGSIIGGAGDGERCLLRLSGASGSGGGEVRALAVICANWAVAGHCDCDTCAETRGLQFRKGEKKIWVQRNLA